MFRRLAVIATAVLSVIAFADAPAMAATNPYSPQQACANDYNGSWSVVSDGTRAVVVPETNARFGTVYLLYNASTGWNCVATVKSQFIGTSTLVDASLSIEGDTYQSRGRSGFFKYYETFAYPARGKCVMYSGSIYNPGRTAEAVGGRDAWGNCG